MLRTTVLAIAVLSAVTACGSADTSAGATSAGATSSSAAAPGDCVPESTDGSGGVPTIAGDASDTSVEAQVGTGGDNPPTELRTEDVVAGTGPVAALTNTVNVNYTGVFYCDGATFDSSWTGGAPVTFPLDGVVPGFAQGIAGMAAGGRRVIVIPPDLGYGDQPNGPVPGGSTLVFVVDLVAIS